MRIGMSIFVGLKKIMVNFTQKISFGIQNIFRNISKNFYLYLVIGICTFSLDYFLYLYLLDCGIGMNIAKAGSSFVAVMFNYFFNSKFNFGGGNKMRLTYLSMYGFLYSMLILIHVIINRVLYLITDDKYVAVFIAMSISVFINYFSIKKFFFYIKSKNNVI